MLEASEPDVPCSISAQETSVGSTCARSCWSANAHLPCSHQKPLARATQAAGFPQSQRGVRTVGGGAISKPHPLASSTIRVAHHQRACLHAAGSAQRQIGALAASRAVESKPCIVAAWRRGPPEGMGAEYGDGGPKMLEATVARRESLGKPSSSSGRSVTWCLGPIMIEPLLPKSDAAMLPRDAVLSSPCSSSSLSSSPSLPCT